MLKEGITKKISGTKAKQYKPFADMYNEPQYYEFEIELRIVAYDFYIDETKV